MEYIVVNKENIIFKGSLIEVVTNDDNKVQGLLCDCGFDSISILLQTQEVVEIAKENIKICDGLMRESSCMRVPFITSVRCEYAGFKGTSKVNKC